LKYFEPEYDFIDIAKDDLSKSIDVIMLTLDAENFLLKSLYSIYKEIPIRKLFVCDGGSKDETINMLKKFPRIEIFVKPEIRTTGKAMEFLMSKVESEWFLLIDSDIELTTGWYNEMIKHKSKLDVIENGKRMKAFHLYVEDEIKKKPEIRAIDLCHLIKKESMKNFHCDDDYMWRYTDILLREITEKSGFKYGKVNSVEHIHHETERIPYESDSEKNFSKFVIEPKSIVVDSKKAEKYNIKHAKAIVKYLDPKNKMMTNIDVDFMIKKLDRTWIEQVNPEWLERYDLAKSLKFRFKFYVNQKRNQISSNKIYKKIKQKNR
jgi:hypothetical protein